jgi:hypothetical protein
MRTQHHKIAKWRVLALLPVLALTLALFSAAGVAAQAEPGATPTSTPTVPATMPPQSQEPEEFPFIEEEFDSSLLDTPASITETLELAIADYQQRYPDAESALAAIEKDFFPLKRIFVRFIPSLQRAPLQQNPPTVTPTPRPDEPRKRADLWVAIWPEPSIRVGRDMELTYEIRLYNDGEAEAQRTVVELPYDNRLIKPIGSRLDRNAGDWVSAVTSNQVTITFGRVDTGKHRSGFVTFKVARDAVNNTVISMRPAYEFSDAHGTRERIANWAPVLVGGGNDTAAYVWLIVNPAAGNSGMLRSFYSNRFAPGERVSAWLNTPNGVLALNRSTTADAQGQVWFDYRPQMLARGTYQMVLYGNQSRLTGVVTFVVN